MMMKKLLGCLGIFTLVFASISVSYGNETATLFFQTDSTTIMADTDFVVQLNIEKVSQLFGYSIDLSYSKDRIHLIDLEEGDFFTSKGLDTTFQSKTDPQSGTIHLASAILGKNYHASGEGLLVSLKFKAKFKGNALIRITKAILKDPELQDITCITRELSLSIQVESEDPILEVEPSFLDFGRIEFGAQPEKTFQVRNIGKGQIQGEVNSLNPWIRVRPQRFTEPGEFTVTIFTNQLTPNNSYDGEIKIRSNAGEKSVMVRVYPYQEVKRDPPKLIIMTPDNNIITKETRLFILCETDPDAFASINQQRLSVDSEDGIFFMNTTLREGVNTFVISVWDAYENRRSETLTITRKTIPPEITVSEIPLFTQQEEIQIQGKTDPKATLLFNRQPIMLGPEGSFSVSYPVVNEMNQLIFTAIDDLGNARTVVRVFFYRPVHPNVILLVVGSNVASFNGRNFDIDAPPIIVEGRVMVPIRVIAEIFGADVDWKPETKTVLISLRYEQIQLVLGNKKAIVNGQPVDLDVTPVIHQGRLMVPIRFISEIFKAVVDWDQELRQVSIRF